MALRVTAGLVLFAAASFAQSVSDVGIQAAIERGRNTATKHLWGEIKKKQQFRINRAGFDPIEKKITFLSDSDRIALEAAEAKRQLRELSMDELKQTMQLGIAEV